MHKHKSSYLKEKHPYLYNETQKKFNDLKIIESMSGALFCFNLMTRDKKASNRYLRKIFNCLDENSTAYNAIDIINEKREEIFSQIRERKFERIFEKECFKDLCEISVQTEKIKKLLKEIKDKSKSTPENKRNAKIAKVEEFASNLALFSRELMDKRRYNFEDERNVEWPFYFDEQFWSKYNKVGYIYVLSNRYMPGLVKIGRADNSACERAKKLTTGRLDKKDVIEHLNKEYEYIKYPEIIADVLSKITGVPGSFRVEYCRKTLLDFKVTKNETCIENAIHQDIVSSMLEGSVWKDENLDFEISGKEFFAVPSIKYAILFVEKYLDRLDFILKSIEQS